MNHGYMVYSTNIRPSTSVSGHIIIIGAIHLLTVVDTIHTGKLHIHVYHMTDQTLHYGKISYGHLQYPSDARYNAFACDTRAICMGHACDLGATRMRFACDMCATRHACTC